MGKFSDRFPATTNQAPATVSLADMAAQIREIADSLRAASRIHYVKAEQHPMMSRGHLRESAEWRERAAALDVLASSLEQRIPSQSANTCAQGDTVTITLRRDRAEWLRGLATVLYAGCPQGEVERHADLVRAVESALSPALERRE